jgi:hypothetical protein
MSCAGLPRVSTALSGAALEKDGLPGQVKPETRFALSPGTDGWKKAGF